MDKQRLDKLMASTGRWSRREAKELIRQGRVRVQGVPARSGQEKAEPDLVTVDGLELGWREYTWVMLNKPAGVLSATEDCRKKTVLDLLPQELRRRGLFPVGRLDQDTEGLLLLTNQGSLAHDLLSPKRHVDKVYFVKTAGRLTEEDCRAFAAGMTLGKTQCLPARLEILLAGEESQARVTLREGKYHQIKRMLAKLGKPVAYLERIQMGPISLDTALPRGAFRILTEEEVKLLQDF